MKILALIFLLAFSTAHALPAFPGAEGFGAQALGGRGGTVCQVTNLNDSGPGSLRDCISQSGPRTVVFRVGGTIWINSTLTITNPFITIAGQTAPGDGIAIHAPGTFAHNKQMMRVYTNNVVVRFVRMRLDRPDNDADWGCCGSIILVGEVSGNDVHDVIFDHVTFGWNTDEAATIYYDAYNTTLQWSIFHEPMYPDPPGAPTYGKGPYIDQNTSNFDFHHNLLIHSSERNPKINPAIRTDIISNIIYNYRRVGVDLGGSTQANVMSNYLKVGPSLESSKRCEIKFNGSTPVLYVENNLGNKRTDDTMDEWVGVCTSIPTPPENCWICSPADPNGQRSTPWPPPKYPITRHEISTFDAKLVPFFGPSHFPRDSAEQRLINDYYNGTGAIINDPTQVGGFPIYSSGTPYTDGDQDGMADNWEVANGLNPSDPNDRNNIHPSGYTMLEVYLADLVEDTFPDGLGDVDAAQPEPTPGSETPDRGFDRGFDRGMNR